MTPGHRESPGYKRTDGKGHSDTGPDHREEKDIPKDKDPQKDTGQEIPLRRTLEGELGVRVLISFTKKRIQIGHPQGKGPKRTQDTRKSPTNGHGRGPCPYILHQENRTPPRKRTPERTQKAGKSPQKNTGGQEIPLRRTLEG